MVAQSIEDIKASLEGLDDDVDGVDSSKFKGQTFGDEQEFSAKSLVAGVRAIVADIRGQLRKPERFFRITTVAERRSIASKVAVLRTALQQQQFESVAQTLQELKLVLRPFQLRGSPETREQLETAVDELHRQVAAIKDERKKIAEEHAKLLELSAEVSARLEESGILLKGIEDSGSTMSDALTEAQQKLDEIDELKSSAASASQSAGESQVSAAASKELVDEFSKKIAMRETQLVDQQVMTVAFTDALAQHRAAMSEIEGEAERIIESARTALSYKTAEGLSAAFNERYTETSEDSKRKFWLIAAGVLVFMAVLLGIWITWDTKVTIAVVAGRVSLIPILIGGAWFCAHQYVKLANIAEEYAYKSVLSKSIVGFSGQMSKENDGESDHSHYIRTVLAEIHTNPLRAQAKKVVPSDRVGEIESAEKLLKIFTDLQKAQK
ncbi:hypothetical protein [Stenotrophomonas sp. YAU14D1_LEIMI4_1]|uniref:hypothetical protein n=1 Tax=Stenotrophomonas sp. YAU14D1_LEIMI4_1 TaxID=2072407 RepID=UPI00131F2DE2|nr:hypothetical protein [Stenotrophomonas sp. YAU14D1_LEIMI4_1]